MSNRYSEYLGPDAPEWGWVPAPRYLLRRHRIREAIQNISTGHLLEIGPGAGALLVEFAQQGLQCQALETSPEACILSRNFLRKFDQFVPVYEKPPPDWEGHFDILCAFEVLEHIEKDAEALELWASWLKPGGLLLISVPAHQDKWCSRDIWAGHCRRYERTELRTLLEQSQFHIKNLECYGFPLANLSEKLGESFYQKKLQAHTMSAERRRSLGNRESGINRSQVVRFYPLLGSIPGKLVLWGFIQLQRFFLSKDIGNGYFVSAVKKYDDEKRRTSTNGHSEIV